MNDSPGPNEMVAEPVSTNDWLKDKGKAIKVTGLEKT
jgi:hypothetical protein